MAVLFLISLLAMILVPWGFRHTYPSHYRQSGVVRARLNRVIGGARTFSSSAEVPHGVNRKR
jgi:hypothetical protein